MLWRGVFPAITTPFNEDLTIDHAFIATHVKWLVENGSKGIVALGSLGEGATLSFDEKVAILKTCVAAVGDQVPIIAGISSLSTAEAVALAKEAEAVGCEGLMVLPPYVYAPDWAEAKFHFNSVIRATKLSCMLYNNPIAYSCDVLPWQIAELAAENENLHSVKESSADIRRLASIRSLIGDRLALFVGMDDILVEGIQAGATGWIAGLVNAFPKESVVLYDLCMAGEYDKAFELYKWFLPLLKLDVVVKFVQLIKLTQQEVNMGSERVRPPRLEVVGAEREAALKTIREGIANRPTL